MKRILNFFGILLSILPLSTLLAQDKCVYYEIYKEDFGGDVGSPNLGKQLPPGITTYSFTDDIPVQDGFYGIRKQVRGHGPAAGNAWHQITDHTGDGYMMLVNADYEPGLFYQKKVNNLCQGTSFRLSVWVANLMKASALGTKDPDLKFVILNPDGKKIIADTTTGLLKRYDRPQWEEYSIDFDLPAGVSSVILQIFNNAEGGDGNDLVLDDITFSICGPPMETAVSGMYQDGANTCAGQEVQLEGKLAAAGYQSPEYQWQFGEDTSQWQDITGAETSELLISNAGVSDSGWYRIVASEKGNIQLKNCRIASDPIPVHVWEPHKPKILSNSPVCEEEQLLLKVPDNEQLVVQWSGPDNFSSDENSIAFDRARPSMSGTYHVEAINPGGCISSNDKKAEVQTNNLSVSFPVSDSIICEGTVRTLDATNPDASYLWNTGATTAQIKTDTGGVFKVTVQQDACTLSDSIRLYSLNKPKINLGNDTTVCEGEPFILHASSPDVEEYQWENGSGDSVLAVTQPGTHAVVLQNYCGKAADTILVEMEACSDQLIFPTAFTPNNDGQNDIFRPKVLLQITDYRLQIFNRWGHTVFKSSDAAKGWDGTLKGQPLPSGTYIWTAKYKRIIDDKHKFQKGVITLIR